MSKKSTPRTPAKSASAKMAPADVVAVLHEVKAWRDAPRQGAFPHELREKLDAVCAANPLPAAS